MSAPTERRQWPVLVAVLAVLVAGVAAIALVGPGQRPTLQIPNSLGDLQRTPSEEVSTPDDLVATYTSGPRVVLLSVTRTDAGDTEISCIATQCVWVSEGLSYTVVDNSGDEGATNALAELAELAVLSANDR